MFKYLKICLCVVLVLCLLLLSACTNSTTTTTVETIDIPVEGPINSDDPSSDLTNDEPSSSDGGDIMDNNSKPLISNPSSPDKNPTPSNPDEVPDQSIGSDNNLGSATVGGETQTVFTPISLADAQKTAKTYMSAMASQYNITDINAVNSGIYNSDNYRIAKLIEKALKGENLTIATLGGSITNGGKADTVADRYANRLQDWFEATFPNIKVTLINAGIGATTSSFGLYRLNEDVLMYDPDLIIIEYAGNDGTREYLVEPYEALLRCALNYKEAAVIPFYFVHKDKKKTAQKTQQATADYYKLPQVSYLDAYGSYSDWNSMFPPTDTIHPSSLGHIRAGFALGQLLTNALNNYNSAQKSYTMPAAKYASSLNHGKDYLAKVQFELGKASFLKATVVNNKVEDRPLENKIKFENNNLSLKKDNYKLTHHNLDLVTVPKGKTLKLTITDIKAFLIIMARDTDCGSDIEVVVTENDTKKKTTSSLNCYYKKLNLWDSGILYRTSNGKPHSVTVEITPKDGAFSFAALGLTD